MEEVWKDIEGYEGLYQVSNMGHVRSLDRFVSRSDGGTRFVSGRNLIAVGEPYLHVSLSKDGDVIRRRVHRLVAEAFIPNPDNLPCVDHIDCDKTNNAASNLRWCTHKQNTGYANDNGLLSAPGFTKWPKESQEHYREVRKKAIVRNDGKRYECCAEAAKDLGVTYGAVMHVLRGLTQTCQGYSFQYA